MTRRFVSALLLGLLASLAADPAPGQQPAQREDAEDRVIANFTLGDYRGKQVSLRDYANVKVLVVAFLGTECPIVKLYAPRLQKLADRYAIDQVQVVGIDSNQQDSLAELAHFARRHAIQFPLLKDPGNRIADQFGAERTPELFVLDSQRVVQYRGRLDDQYTYEIQRPQVQQDYVTAAIDQLLAGQAVEVARTEPVGCHIGRVMQHTEDRGVTYANQISRLLQRRCVECHRTGEIAPFALTDYDEVVGWAEMIREVVQDQRMPPWHAAPEHGQFANDRRLSDDEKKLLYQWIDDGAPLGDAAQRPEPETYVQGWQLPQQPDLVIPMRDRPYQVPAEGVVEYQYFVVDPQFREDKWVSMAECQPGNRQVVHHILVFAQPPGSRPIGGERGGFLAAYVPGLRARPYGPGMAKRVPAGSKLIFQLHYTPVGTAQQDLSSLGLVFLPADEVEQEVRTVAAVETDLKIPPHDANFQVDARSPKAPIAVELLALMPHMHLRGKSFRYVAEFPGGKKETLLDVPRYDFNWQTAYRLQDPLRLPPGTQIHCTAHYDNSSANLANPDPTQLVRWGDQTDDEMMIGYFDIALPVRRAGQGGRR